MHRSHSHKCVWVQIEGLFGVHTAVTCFFCFFCFCSDRSRRRIIFQFSPSREIKPSEVKVISTVQKQRAAASSQKTIIKGLIFGFLLCPCKTPAFLHVVRLCPPTLYLLLLLLLCLHLLLVLRIATNKPPLCCLFSQNLWQCREHSSADVAFIL